jgi:hypothetical protein
MPNLKIRGFGGVGLIKDLPASDIPPNAWTTANNVRFNDQYVERSGIFKDLGVDLSELVEDPAHMDQFVVGTTRDDLIIVGRDNSIFRWNTATKAMSDVTPTSEDWSDTPTDYPVYSAMVAGGHTITSKAGWPVGLRPDDTEYSPLMDSNDTYKESHWRCMAIWQDRVIVANGSKTGVGSWPYRVMWSDPVQNGQLATGWAVDDPLATAGWVDLSGLDSEILDISVLEDILIVYTRNGAIRMWDSGGSEIFANQKTSMKDGVISSKCVATIPNMGHFIVGNFGFYLFNGTTVHQIGQDKVDTWFRRMVDLEKRDYIRVHADYSATEMWVMFPSMDADARWQDTPYANQALVWNWSNDTWATRDIPNVTSATAIFFKPSQPPWDTLGPELLEGGTGSHFTNWFHDDPTPRYITDPKKSWEVDEWAGKKIIIRDYKGKGEYTTSVVSNTANRLYIADKATRIFYTIIDGKYVWVGQWVTGQTPQYEIYNTDEEISAANVSWADTGGTWADSNQQLRHLPIFMSGSSDDFTEPQALVYDSFASGSLITLPERNALYAKLEKIGEDGDQIGVPISAHIFLTEFIPQGSALPGEIFKVSLGSSLVPDNNYSWSEAYEFDPGVDRWVNGRKAGRYVGWRIESEGFNQLKLSGADVNIEILANR